MHKGTLGGALAEIVAPVVRCICSLIDAFENPYDSLSSKDILVLLHALALMLEYCMEGGDGGSGKTPVGALRRRRSLVNSPAAASATSSPSRRSFGQFFKQARLCRVFVTLLCLRIHLCAITVRRLALQHRRFVTLNVGDKRSINITNERTAGQTSRVASSRVRSTALRAARRALLADLGVVLRSLVSLLVVSCPTAITCSRSLDARRLVFGAKAAQVIYIVSLLDLLNSQTRFAFSKRQDQRELDCRRSAKQIRHPRSGMSVCLFVCFS
jgi:hypothetical protein